MSHSTDSVQEKADRLQPVSSAIYGQRELMEQTCPDELRHGAGILATAAARSGGWSLAEYATEHGPTDDDCSRLGVAVAEGAERGIWDDETYDAMLERIIQCREDVRD